MIIDIYTKIVLTVIAACLVILVVKDTDMTKKAYATYGNNVVDVRIVGIQKDNSTLNSPKWDSLPVTGSVNVTGSVDASINTDKFSKFSKGIPVIINDTVPVDIKYSTPIEISNTVPVDIANTQQILPVYITNQAETKTKKK